MREGEGMGRKGGAAGWNGVEPARGRRGPGKGDHCGTAGGGEGSQVTGANALALLSVWLSVPLLVAALVMAGVPGHGRCLCRRGRRARMRQIEPRAEYARAQQDGERGKYRPESGRELHETG